MKKIFTIFIFGVIIIACSETDKKETEVKTPKNEQPGGLDKVLEDTANFTAIHWLDSTYQDLGKVEEGRVVDVAFRFKNTGDKPLIISSVSTGCGCTTVPEKPKGPFAPGEEGVIKAKFDSKNMAGERVREVFVNANTRKSTSHILLLRVDVVKK